MQLQDILYSQGFGTRRICAGLIQQGHVHITTDNALVMCDDALHDIDVHDPKAWEGQVLCSAPERSALQTLLEIGLHDGLRLVEPSAQLFTWWDYRMNAFKRKMGLRIDHILVSTALAPKCRACVVDLEPRRHERPSDHAPVSAEFAV